jgi:hypothetical protein
MMDRINMADIKCGDVFWECEDGQNCQVVTLQGREIATNQPLALMMRLSAPAYAPRLYRTPQ